MAVASYWMSPEGKAKRELYLAGMRSRYRSRSATAKGHERRKRSILLPRRHPYCLTSNLAVALGSLQVDQDFWMVCSAPWAHQIAYKLRIKIKTRTVYKNGVKGIRIWRTE